MVGQPLFVNPNIGQLGSQSQFIANPANVRQQEQKAASDAWILGTNPSMLVTEPLVYRPIASLGNINPLMSPEFVIRRPEVYSTRLVRRAFTEAFTNPSVEMLGQTRDPLKHSQFEYERKETELYPKSDCKFLVQSRDSAKMLKDIKVASKPGHNLKAEDLIQTGATAEILGKYHEI